MVLRKRRIDRRATRQAVHRAFEVAAWCSWTRIAGRLAGRLTSRNSRDPTLTARALWLETHPLPTSANQTGKAEKERGAAMRSDTGDLFMRRQRAEQCVLGGALSAQKHGAGPPV
jgi:hypothetical protein